MSLSAELLADADTLLSKLPDPPNPRAASFNDADSAGTPGARKPTLFKAEPN